MMQGKRILTKLVMLAVVLFAAVLLQSKDFRGNANECQAASVKKNTKKAKALYKKKINSIYYDSVDYSYKITNIVGDKVPELLINYTAQDDRHGTFKIYTYKKGKLKTILNTSGDNLELYQYKKTKTLITAESYHDYKAQSYFQYKNGKYRLKARSCRNDIASPSQWYENSKGNSISKSKFKKTVKKLKKGKKKNLRTDQWTYQAGSWGY